MAQFTNQASISYNGLTANSNIVTGEITRVLSVSKTSVSGSYRRGDTLTYAVSISNTGSAPYTGLTVTDDLGAYTAGTASGNAPDVCRRFGSVLCKRRSSGRAYRCGRPHRS